MSNIVKLIANRVKHLPPCRLSLIDICTSIIFALGVISCLHKIHIPQYYMNFTCGYITLSNSSKTKDFAFIAIFLVVVYTFLLLINSLYLAIGKRFSNNHESIVTNFKTLMLVTLSPTAITMLASVFQNKIVLLGYVISFILQIFSIFMFITLLGKNHHWIQRHTHILSLQSMVKKLLQKARLVLNKWLSWSISPIEILTGVIFTSGMMSFVLTYKTLHYSLNLATSVVILFIYLSLVAVMYKIVNNRETFETSVFVVGYRKLFLVLIFPALIYPAQLVKARVGVHQLMTGCDPSLMLLSALLITTFLLLLRFRKYGYGVASTFLRVLAVTICFFVFLLFDGFALSLIVTRLSPSLATALQATIKYLPYIPLLIGTIIWLISYLKQKEIDLMGQKIFNATCYAQVGLPFLLLCLKPPFWEINNVIINRIEYSSLFPLFLLIVISVLLISIKKKISEYKIKNLASHKISNILSSASLVSIIVYLYAGSYSQVIPQTFIGSLYEMGKYYLSWQQLYWFHRLPYYNLNYAHGFGQLMLGFINWLFFHENTGTFFYSFLINTSALILLVYFFIRAITEKVIAVILSLTVCISNITLICALLHDRVIKNPLLWIIIWSISFPLTAILTPSIGIPILLASVPFAIFMLFAALKQQLKQTVMFIALVACILAALLIFTPAAQIVKSFILYLSINAKNNPIIWGTAFWHDRNVPLQVYRLMCIPISLIAFVILWRELASRKNDKQILFLSSTMILFFIFSLPYSFGRIDPGALSRLGIVTAIEFAFLLVLFYLRSREKAKYYVGIYFMALILMPLNILHINIQRIIANSQIILRPSIQQLLLLQQTNKVLPYMSNTIMAPKHLRLLINTKHFLRSVLRKNEYFANFTNVGVFYYNLQYPIMVPEINPANIAAIQVQKRTISAIKENHVKVILIAPRLSIDNAFNLRNGLLYLYLLKYYAPINYDGLIFLVANNAIRSKYFPESMLMQLESHQQIDGDSYINNKVHILKLLNQALPIKNIEKTAISWGQSIQYLKKHMVLLSTLSSEKCAKQKQCVYNVRKINIPEYSAAFVSFKIACNSSKDYPATVSWVAKNNIFNDHLDMSVSNGTMLVPLYVKPSWYLGHSFTSITVQVKSKTNYCTVSQAKLWRLSDKL